MPKLRFPGGATLRRVTWSLARSTLISNRQRQAVLRFAARGRFRESWIGPHVTLVVPDELIVEPGCFINEGVFLDRHVHLERNVYIGPRAMLITARHAMGGPGLRAAPGVPDPLRIGAGAWIGAGAIILPGVHVGPGCVIAAGAVVTRSCEANGLYAGVPAKRIKNLPTTPSGAL